MLIETSLCLALSDEAKDRNIPVEVLLIAPATYATDHVGALRMLWRNQGDDPDHRTNFCAFRDLVKEMITPIIVEDDTNPFFWYLYRR